MAPHTAPDMHALRIVVINTIEPPENERTALASRKCSRTPAKKNATTSSNIVSTASASHAHSRWYLQEVLMEVWTRTKLTTIMVTHDVDEAILLADRVVLMTNDPNAKVGKIMEVNLPRPCTRKKLLEHPDYYRLREELLSFLNECDHTH